MAARLLVIPCCSPWLFAFPTLLFSVVIRISPAVLRGYSHFTLLCFRLRTAPSAAGWAGGGSAEQEVSLFDFVGMARRGGPEHANGSAAAEKLREEFNSLLAGGYCCCLYRDSCRVTCDMRCVTCDV